MTEAKKKTRRKRKVTPHTKRKHNGIFNGYWADRSEATRGHVHSWFRLIIALAAIYGLGQGWFQGKVTEIAAPIAEAESEEKVGPVVAQMKEISETLREVNGTADLNSQAILNLNETMNMQFEWFRTEQAKACAERKENRERVDRIVEGG